MRTFCSETIGTLNTHRYIQPQQFDRWQSTVKKTLHKIIEKFGAFADRTKNLKEECAKLEGIIEGVREVA